MGKSPRLDRSKQLVDFNEQDDRDFKEFMKRLASLQKVPLRNGCPKGGGNPACVIRMCAKEKKVSDCGQCELLKTSRDFEMFQRSRLNIRTTC